MNIVPKPQKAGNSFKRQSLLTKTHSNMNNGIKIERIDQFSTQSDLAHMMQPKVDIEAKPSSSKASPDKRAKFKEKSSRTREDLKSSSSLALQNTLKQSEILRLQRLSEHRKTLKVTRRQRRKTLLYQEDLPIWQRPCFYQAIKGISLKKKVNFGRKNLRIKGEN